MTANEARDFVVCLATDRSVMCEAEYICFFASAPAENLCVPFLPLFKYSLFLKSIMNTEPDGQVARSSSFQQQGTVDWTAIASKFMGYSLDVLSRLSNANVDAYTLVVGKVLSRCFEFSYEGKNNVNTALKSLYAHGPIGDALWFGFGIRHIVRELPNTEEGSICLALCGSLIEFYHEPIAAAILHELARSFNAPEEYTPSLNQWKSLLQACSGVFSTSELGVLITKYCAKHPDGWRTTTGSHTTCAKPKSIAQALIAIAKVSKGEGKLARIKIIGDNDIGFLAAFCQVFLGLSFELQDHQGHQLFASSPGQETQIYFIFNKHRGSASPTHPESLSSELQMVNRTFLLEDGRSLFQDPLTGGNDLTSGRVPWNNLFGAVFGLAFEDLMEKHSRIVSQGVGSAARIFSAIALAEEGIPPTWVMNWSGYSFLSHGSGFIEHVSGTFPELAPLKRDMAMAARKSLVDARAIYENQVGILLKTCPCEKCDHYNQDSNNAGMDCLVKIFEFIIVLGSTLVDVEVAKDLFPKRSGVRRIFRQYSVAHRIDKDAFPSVLKGLGGPASLLVHMGLFTGAENPPMQELAVASGGICLFYDSLLHGLSDDAESYRKVHIVPGAIQFTDRSYPYILGPMDRNWDQAPEKCHQDLRTSVLYRTSQFCLVQGIDSLHVSFNLRADPGSNLPTIEINPHSFIYIVGAAKGLIFCSGKGSCRKFIEGALDITKQIDVHGHAVHVSTGPLVERLAAIQMASLMEYVLLLQDHGCIQCTLRTALNERMDINSMRDSTQPASIVIVGSHVADSSLVI